MFALLYNKCIRVSAFCTTHIVYGTARCSTSIL